MSALLWNIMLAGAWTAITGDLSVPNLLVGVALGAVILASTRQAVGIPQYPTKVRQAFMLVAFFTWALLRSNFWVARDVLRPRTRIRPAIVAVPLDATTDADIALLAGLITLTPGTTSIDVSPDRRLMYVHLLNIEGSDLDLERFRLKDGFERRMLRVTQ